MNQHDSLLRSISQASGVPLKVLYDFWDKGKDISYPAMVDLNSPEYLAGNNLMLLEGITREYYTDRAGKEHTLRFVQAPGMMSPSWTQYIVNKPTKVSSQSLSPLKGRIWTFDQVNALTAQDTRFFKVMLLQMIEALRIKNLKEIRQHQCSAKERYELFLDEFPGLINSIPLKYVASYLKITSETLSRIRAELSQS